MKLSPLPEIIADMQRGVPIVMVDDADRENEGDLVLAAEKTTSESINFMIQEGKGLICISLTGERLEELAIPLQVAENTSVFGTNFGVSFDEASVAQFGGSARARATTILKAVDPSAKARDFVMPGSVYPVAAVPGGVLKRRGQTEGSVDLARIAGLKPAGVICEIMGADGKMLRGATLANYCAKHKLKITSVEEIVQYRLRNEVSIRRVGSSDIGDFDPVTLPGANEKIDLGKFTVVVYIDDVDGLEHLAFVKGKPGDGCLVRIHSECVTGDVFESVRCDCGSQFQTALMQISQAGSGVLIYLHQEGRGIGLANKLRAYALQDQGLDTVDANLKLGFEADLRNYRAGAQILADLSIKSIRLMTNNPQKVSELESFGIKVLERVSVYSVDPHNARYLSTKRDRMGHFLPK